MTNTDTKKVYVIILNWNGIEDTKECITSLLQSDDAGTIHIVVLDNGSNNNEGKRLKKQFPFITLLPQPQNIGFTGGNNMAITHCLTQPDCEYIMLLNNDTTVARSFLAPLLATLKNKQHSVVSPTVVYYHKPDVIQSQGLKVFFGGVKLLNKHKKINNTSNTPPPDALSGTCLVTQAKHFKTVGLLDDAFFAYYEDVDWSLRAKKAGLDLIIATQSIVYHKHSQSTKQTYTKPLLIGKNTVYLAKKHFTRLYAHSFIIASLIIGFGATIYTHKSLKAGLIFLQGSKQGFFAKVSKKKPL